MKGMKTGKNLWNTIEEAARKKHNVGEDYKLTMVDLGFFEQKTIGHCEYRINNQDGKFMRGFVDFNPYINE